MKRAPGPLLAVMLLLVILMLGYQHVHLRVTGDPLPGCDWQAWPVRVEQLCCP